MTVTVSREQDVVREALDILQQNLAPSKIVRLLAALQMGEGNYLALRGPLFEGETVATLFDKVQAYEVAQSSAKDA